MLLKMERVSWLQGSRFQASSRPEFKCLAVQSPSVQPSRVQAPSCPESKSPVVQSPSVQSPRVQKSRAQMSRVQASRPYAQSPDFPVCLFKRCHSNLSAIYCNRFCNNVGTSLSCLFIQLTN